MTVQIKKNVLYYFKKEKNAQKLKCTVWPKNISEKLYVLRVPFFLKWLYKIKKMTYYLKKNLKCLNWLKKNNLMYNLSQKNVQ